MQEEKLAEVTKRIFGESGIQVKYTARQGRHIWTTKGIAAGQIVLVSQPYTLIVGENYLNTVCHACFSVADEGETFSVSCRDCKYAWYCSEECKESHFNELHLKECDYLAKLKEKTKKFDKGFAKAKMRHLLRLIILRDKERATKAADKPLPDGPRFEDVAALVSHDVGNNVDEYTQIANLLKEVLPSEMVSDPASELVELLVRTDCNQFGLWSVDDDLLGVTVHPAASFFNHSCLPNCYCEWRGVNLVFRALYPIPADSELVISYIAGNEPTRKRKKELSKVYHFDCVCPRCVRYEAPTEAYDAFYYRYLQCPKCTGIMKLDIPRKKKRMAVPFEDNISDGPNSENRSCMTCSRKRLNTEPVPSVPEFLKRYDPETDLEYIPQKGEKVPKRVVPVLDEESKSTKD